MIACSCAICNWLPATNRTLLCILECNLKTMRVLFYLALSVLPLLSYCQGKSYEIQGTIAGEYTDSIYLFFDGNTRQGDSLSAAIKDGKFHFKGKVSALPALAQFHFADKSLIMDVYIDNPKTEIACTNKFVINGNGDTAHLLRLISVKGSKTDKLRSDYERELERVLSNQMSEEQKKAAQYQHLSAFIRKYPKSKVSAYQLSRVYDYNYQEVKALQSLLDASLADTYEGRSVQRLLSDLYKPMYLNTAFYDVVLNDSSDKLIDTKQFRGKYTLVVGWASWCIPCRAENPELNILYQKYKDRGFEMVGVSFDKQKQDWMKAVRKDELKWPQLIDVKAYEGELAKKYSVQAIPINFLLDPQGKIIGIDLSLKEIDEKLSELIP